VKQRIAKKRHSILSGMTTVAVKTLLLAEHGREEDLHRQFIKEVAYYFLLCYIHITPTLIIGINVIR